MRGVLAAAALSVAAAALLVAPAGRRVVQLPAGVVEVGEEMVVPANTEMRGAAAGTTLHASAQFRGRALLVCTGANVRLRGFTLDGNRAALEQRTGLPPSDRSFARFTRLNGVLAEKVDSLRVEDVEFREIAGFAILVSASRHVAIARVRIQASGSRDAGGRNNTTGGILLEEGTRDFAVANCALSGIRGNGIWTHSLYTSPRNGPGSVEGNAFDRLGRDAIQIGHAFGVTVRGNGGRNIGFPVEDVDVERQAIPVAIDTAGNVERSAYVDNRFREINGKCIDLDGFHDGEVARNTCINTAGGYGIVMNNTNPDMQSRNIRVTGNEIRGARFGGIFVIGSGHTVRGNRLLDLNTARCNEEAARFGCYYPAGEPELLQSGIYLGRGAERPALAHSNLIEGNTITGFKMAARCVASAPGVSRAANTVRHNICRDE